MIIVDIYMAVYINITIYILSIVYGYYVDKYRRCGIIRLNLKSCLSAINPDSQAEFSEDWESIATDENDSISQKEYVELNEAWRFSIYQNCDTEEVLLEEPISHYTNFTTTTGSPISTVPERVFTERGKWASKNNPNYPSVGYYANTGIFAGTENNLTYIIRWEYIYNSPGNILAGSYDCTGIGTTGLHILEIGEYTYNKSRNRIEHTATSAPLRIKSAAVVVGLGSDQQILKWGQTKCRIKSDSNYSGFKSLIGLIPKGKYISIATTIFDTLKYNLSNTSTGPINMTFGDTAKKQMDADRNEGMLVRGNKIAMGDKWFSNAGDNCTIDYTIVSPPDLPRSAGLQNASSKFYFSVYERDLYGIYNVKASSISEVRNASYRVAAY